MEERNAARQAELELKREERKRDGFNERAQPDRERSKWKAASLRRWSEATTFQKGCKPLWNLSRASTAALHDENRGIARALARYGKQGRWHHHDRVDLIYEKRRTEMINFTARIRTRRSSADSHSRSRPLLLVQVVAAPIRLPVEFGVLERAKLAAINPTRFSPVLAHS